MTYNGGAPAHWGGYKQSSSRQERGDVVTLCVYSNHVLPLIRLAQTLQHNLAELWRISGLSQMFNRPSGLSTVFETAFCSYFMLNILYCKPELHTPVPTDRGTRDYRLCCCYCRAIVQATCEDDHDYWAMSHRTFRGRGRYSLKGVNNKRDQPILEHGKEVDPLGDGHAEELKEYLRGCWSWIVRCIMVGREWGFDFDLPMELLGIFMSLNFLT